MLPLFVLRSCIFVAAATTVGCSTNTSAATPAAGAKPVVVELFTSQGCSSCPPADAVLQTLGKRSDVIALSFHVDYWDYIGWKDPFSQAQWSKRQKAYAKSLKKSTYTPQVVIAGQTQTIGSKKSEIEKLITLAQTQQQNAAPVLSAQVTKQKSHQWRVQTTASKLGDAKIVVILRETAPATRVLRGENAARRLTNPYVVRSVTPIDASGGADITIDNSWKTSSLDVVVLAQRPGQGAIVAAAFAKTASP